MGLVLPSPFHIDNDHSLLSPPHCKCAGVGDMELEPLKEDNIYCVKRESFLPPFHLRMHLSKAFQCNQINITNHLLPIFFIGQILDGLMTWKLFWVLGSASNRVLHANIRQNFWSINYKYMKVGWWRHGKVCRLNNSLYLWILSTIQLQRSDIHTFILPSLSSYSEKS